MTKEQIEAVLESVRSWPRKDQEELAGAAREIEARRTGVHVMTDEERGAVSGAREGRLASHDEVTKFWKSRGIA
jgi:hypothetical protein